MNRNMLAIGFLIGLGLSFSACTADAETVKFRADMKAATEVPPNDSTAAGTADITLDTTAKTLTWVANTTGLTGNATAAHFHGPAAEGENAGPVIDVTANITSGTSPISDDQITMLQDGKMYLNVHTEQYPDGEIRGQVMKAQ
jgi:CHRD domain